MAMNVQTITTVDDRINQIRLATAEIINEDILPNEDKLWAGRKSDSSKEARRQARELRHQI